MKLLQEINKLFQEWEDLRLIKKIIKRLDSTNKEELLYIEHRLNGWKIPEQFLDIIPFDLLKRIGTRRFMKVFNIVNTTLNAFYTKKEQLYFHNVVMRGNMSPGEFEYWYETIGGTDEVPDDIVNKYYVRKDIMETIEWWKDDVFEKISHALNQNNNNERVPEQKKRADVKRSRKVNRFKETK